jgi:glutathione S-transferase
MANDVLNDPERYRLYGSIGSPYALKLRSLMRYKRLRFDWVPATLDWIPQDLPHPPLCHAANKELEGLTPRVIPAIYFPDDSSVRNESTALAYLLDLRHPARPAIPADPDVAFLSHLIEDMADEWFVKMAFHYRWGNEADAAYKSRIVSGEFLGGNYDRSTLSNAARHFAARQQSRMPLVGCTAENAPMIEAGFVRMLGILDRVADRSTFLFGASPTLADFGVYGQLQSLATDPKPWSVMRDAAVGVFPYLQLLEDASGIDPAVISLSGIGEATIDLLRFAAKFYLPYLKANEQALNDRQPSFSIEVDGLRYSQAPFKYHVKCYRALREKYQAIPPGRRAAVDDILGSADALTGGS